MASAIRAAGAKFLRAFNVDGVPSSGPAEPDKAEGRAVFDLIDAALASLGVNGAITVKYAARATLFGDLSYAANTLAVVYNDGTAANNGIYAKVGASGSGYWILTGLALPSSFAGDLAEVQGLAESAGERVGGVETALSGQSFARAPSLGFFQGRPVLTGKYDANGVAIEITTSAGLFVIGASGGLERVGQPAKPGYLGGANAGTGIEADPTICYIYVGLGQSNQEGVMPVAEGAVIASTPIYPGYALMPSTGVRLDTRDGGTAKAPPSRPAFTALVNMVEAADADIHCYETSTSSAVNHLIASVEGETGRRIRVAGFVAALGSSLLSGLLPGSTTYAWVLRGLMDVTAAIRAQGWRPVLLPISFRHGEADAAADTSPVLYAGGLLKLISALNTDWAAILGEPAEVKMVLDAPQLWDTAVENDMLSAQVAATERDQRLLLGAPYYQMPRTTAEPIHMTAQGQNRVGINTAKALFDEVFSTGHFAYVPTDWWFEAGKTSLTLRFPRPPVFDLSGADVAASGLPNYRGLYFDDRSGSPPTITGQSVTGEFLTLTLSGASSGPRPRVSYATMPNASGVPGPVSGARGLLRSNRPAIISIYGGASIFEWARPFILNF